MGNRQSRHQVVKIEPAEIQELQIIANGSFGTVIKGKWKGSLVAVKYSLRNPSLFLGEIWLMFQLDHPNIVKCYGAHTAKPGMFLVMEFATQGSVAERIYGKFAQFYSNEQGVRWALQCARGLAYLHNFKPKPIIHRDIKPANLLLFDNEVVKIGDFGLAQDQFSPKMKNCRVGSLLYMAPEVRKRQKYSEKCDVYSWALVLWAILARKRPHRNNQNEKPALPKEFPKKVRKLIEKSWDAKPSQRPSILQVVEDLEDIVDRRLIL